MAAAKGTTLPSFCILDSLQGVLPERAENRQSHGAKYQSPLSVKNRIATSAVSLAG
jgi:hypothetical protein